MPTDECPTCKTALEIPDELIGKKIKCPECKMIFTATMGPAPIEPPGPPRAPPSSQVKSEDGVRVRRKAPSIPSDGEENDEEEQEETIRVRKKPMRQRDEEDEEDQEDEEDEEEELPRRRRRRLSSPRQRARSIVLAPAISLMVVGALSILAAITSTIGLFTTDRPPEGGFIPIVVVITISQVCMGAATIAGAFYLKNLTSYGYSMLASIVAMLPCTLCVVAGLPVGVWSLITINRSDVKPYFRPT